MTAPAAAVDRAPVRCASGPGRVIAEVAGTVEAGGEFRAAVGPGWTFALLPATHGWQVALLDRAGLDLSQITPPYRFAPNPRELYGWHFRNADNTGPNDGSVNAAQERRLFLFDPALSGTAGFKPPSGDATAVEGAPGRGALVIEDFTLADLAPGKQARFARLRFHACLSWPESAGASPPPADAAAAARRFASCGLPASHAVGDFLQPSVLEGDFDGDGTTDAAAPAVRKRDGKRGLAVCRGGTRLDLLGFEQVMGEVVPAYFDRIDRWLLHPRGPVGRSAEQGVPPILAGDAITIGKDDSSSALLYWRDGRWGSYWQGD